MTKPSAVNIHRTNPPDWFKQADFGIIIHWGPYSVPAYAPVNIPDYGTLIKTKSLGYLFEHQPYAEWYGNSMLLPNSPVAAYHRTHYGNTSYADFAKTFKQTAQNVDVQAWAEAFANAGAKYVVIVTKHHDGFVMFDPHTKNPYEPDYHLNFDFVGELAQAVRAHGMRFGTYYSSLLDWTFPHLPIKDYGSFLLGNDKSQTYKDYVWRQWHELIDRYHPDVLWSDIGYPDDHRLETLFKYYYQQVPEGLVNDRWQQFPDWMRTSWIRPIFNLVAAQVIKRDQHHSDDLSEVKYYDYRTLEYRTDWPQTNRYFEMTRGMDKSFGYNRLSRPEDYITADDIKQLIAELRSKRGRLLLNVGPDMNGQIPSAQLSILQQLSDK